jgi:hypothetical protein
MKILEMVDCGSTSTRGDICTAEALRHFRLIDHAAAVVKYGIEPGAI